MKICGQVKSGRPESLVCYECIIEVWICHKSLDGQPVASDCYISYIYRNGVVGSKFHQILVVEGKVASEGRVAAQTSWQDIHSLLTERRLVAELGLPHCRKPYAVGPHDAGNISVNIVSGEDREHIGYFHTRHYREDDHSCRQGKEHFRQNCCYRST